MNGFVEEAISLLVASITWSPSNFPFALLPPFVLKQGGRDAIVAAAGRRWRGDS